MKRILKTEILGQKLEIEMNPPIFEAGRGAEIAVNGNLYRRFTEWNAAESRFADLAIVLDTFEKLVETAHKETTEND